jgi:hypothetical protein
MRLVMFFTLVFRTKKRSVNKSTFAVLALCLLLAACGTLSIGVSNSPDWCPNPRSTVPCP